MLPARDFRASPPPPFRQVRQIRLHAKRLWPQREMEMEEGNRPDTGSVLLEMRNIWKSFPGVAANRGIDLTLRVGEIHALLGENGAGKSTLMNILAGLYRPDDGQILLCGAPLTFRSPADAIAAGIGMVHQHFRLVEQLSVAENIHLGWKETPQRISPAVLAQRTEKICCKYGLNIDCSAKIWQLSTGEQQRVEIVRVLARGARVLILDEPTAVLTPNEATELFQVARALADGGRAVVFISHKLEEVVAVSDCVTILRSGEKIAHLRTCDANERLLARLMVGQDIVSGRYERPREEGAPILDLRGARAVNDRGLPALVDVDLTLREKEIVGVAGVAGNGQSELAEVLTGLRPLSQGTLRVKGKDLTGRSALQFAQAGIGHIPEDRIGRGLVADLSVMQNAILREYNRPPICRGLRLDNKAASGFAQELVLEADVRVPGVGTKVHHLSGGNQQRLLARREMRIAQHLLVAVHPTRGLDIAATESVRQALLEHRNRGGAVLLISEDLDEVLLVADRIVVMYEGRIVGEFEASTARREALGLLMGGATAEASGFGIVQEGDCE